MARQRQPEHLRSEHVLNAIRDNYPDDLLDTYKEKVEKGCKAEIFEYSHANRHQDREAMYKYKDVAKACCELNPAGVWNYLSLKSAIAKWDSKTLGKKISCNDIGCTRAASNLAAILQDFRRAKTTLKNGSRTPQWLSEILKFLADVKDTDVQIVPNNRPRPADELALAIPDRSVSRVVAKAGPKRKPRRVLSFQLSTESEQVDQPIGKPKLLAICDDTTKKERGQVRLGRHLQHGETKTTWRSLATLHKSGSR